MQPTLVSAMNELFSGLYGRGCMQAQLSDRAFLQAMLDVELALMRALVHCDLAPPEAARELAAECDAAGFDLEELGLELPAVVEELGPAGLEYALAPEQYLGVADKLIDRALAAHQAAARASATEA